MFLNIANWLFTDPDNVKEHKPTQTMNAVNSADLMNQDSDGNQEQLSY